MTWIKKITNSARTVSKLWLSWLCVIFFPVHFMYRLTHSVSELVGFTCTNSLLKNEKFQYRALLSAVSKISSSVCSRHSDCYFHLSNNSDGKTSLNGRERRILQRTHKMWVNSNGFTCKMFIFCNIYRYKSTIFLSPYYSLWRIQILKRSSRNITPSYTTRNAFMN